MMFFFALTIYLFISEIERISVFLINMNINKRRVLSLEN